MTSFFKCAKIKKKGAYMKKNEIMSSDKELFIKYRRVEIMSVIILIIGFIIAACSAFFRFKGGNKYYVFIAMIVVGLCLMLIGFIIFSIFYFKIKRLKEK